MLILSRFLVHVVTLYLSHLCVFIVIVISTISSCLFMSYKFDEICIGFSKSSDFCAYRE